MHKYLTVPSCLVSFAPMLLQCVVQHQQHVRHPQIPARYNAPLHLRLIECFCQYRMIIVYEMPYDQLWRLILYGIVLLRIHSLSTLVYRCHVHVMSLAVLCIIQLSRLLASFSNCYSFFSMNGNKFFHRIIPLRNAACGMVTQRTFLQNFNFFLSMWDL